MCYSETEQIYISKNLRQTKRYVSKVSSVMKKQSVKKIISCCFSISGHHGSMSKSTLVSICTDISAGEHRNLNPEARVNDTFVLYKHHPQTCGTSDTIKTVCVEAKCVQIGNLIRHQKDSLRNSCKSQPADDSLDIR